MKSRTNRRQFVKAAAASPFAFHLLPASAKGANSRVTAGCVGIGGKGQADTQGVYAAGAEVIALCDVADPGNKDLDRKKKGARQGLAAKFPGAKIYPDYREMIANEDIDAVTVSTPDHSHCTASVLAMRKGLHVYCQKPLSRTVAEARLMTEVAKKTGVVTAMGNQAHAGEPIRRAVELIRAGIVGKVTEVHAWTNRPIWPQGMTERPPAEKVPNGLNWDLWLGPSEFVDYSSKYAPFVWRGWWGWGTGALGDMACHIMDMPFWALGLGSPSSIEATQNGNTALSGPNDSVVTYHFPESQLGGPVKYCWYDGLKQDKKSREYTNTPPKELWEDAGKTADHIFRKFDLVVVGEKGRFFFGRSRTDWKCMPENLVEVQHDVPKTLPRAPKDGNGKGDPYKEFVEAIRGGQKPASDFVDYSGPFTETILLGNLAVRLGKKIAWDGKAMKATNTPEAASLIRPVYRKGWELEGI